MIKHAQNEENYGQCDWDWFGKEIILLLVHAEQILSCQAKVLYSLH